MTPRLSRTVYLASCLLVLVGLTHASVAEEASGTEHAAKRLQLPGIAINPEEGFVDVTSKVCLTEGLLEVIATTEGNREHEAVIMIKASPVHLHTALLLIGARNGTPAMRKPINEEQTRWMHYPPSGDPIKVSLVIKDKEDKPIERPISDFIRKTEGDPYIPDFGGTPGESEDEKEKEKFPDVFAFTGSHLITNEDGSKQYLADISGNVITISTFGDETLGLAEFTSRENGELVWEIDSTHLPPLDSEVILRLRPQRGPTE